MLQVGEDNEIIEIEVEEISAEGEVEALAIYEKEEIEIEENVDEINTYDKDLEEYEDSDPQDTNEGTVTPQAAVVLGGSFLIGKLLIATAITAGVIIVAGVTYHAASTAKAKSKVKTANYFYARLNTKEDVYIGPAFQSQSKAATYMKAGGNVFASNSTNAFNVCKSASPISKVSSQQNHKGKGSGKTYYHRHPMRTSKAQASSHCWYY